MYLAVRKLFALVWLLARPRCSKELEILVLRHEIAMLRRQARQPRPTRADRALLAALSRSLTRIAWAGYSVKPETLLHWHRQLVARRWTSAHRAPGRPPLESSVRELILRLAEENGHWGYKRIVGQLKGLGIAASATSVRKVLLAEGLQPAPQRSQSSWRTFLRASGSQNDALGSVDRRRRAASGSRFEVLGGAFDRADVFAAVPERAAESVVEDVGVASVEAARVSDDVSKLEGDLGQWPRMLRLAVLASRTPSGWKPASVLAQVLCTEFSLDRVNAVSAERAKIRATHPRSEDREQRAGVDQ